MVYLEWCCKARKSTLACHMKKRSNRHFMTGKMSTKGTYKTEKVVMQSCLSILLMITLLARGAPPLDKNNHEKTVIYIKLSLESTVLQKPKRVLLQLLFILRGKDIWWVFSFGLLHPRGRACWGIFTALSGLQGAQEILPIREKFKSNFGI